MTLLANQVAALVGVCCTRFAPIDEANAGWIFIVHEQETQHWFQPSNMPQMIATLILGRHATHCASCFDQLEAITKFRA